MLSFGMVNQLVRALVAKCETIAQNILNNRALVSRVEICSLAQFQSHTVLVICIQCSRATF